MTLYTKEEILAFLDTRLQAVAKIDVIHYPLKDRNYFRQRRKGRMMELCYLKQLLSEGRLKSQKEIDEKRMEKR
jgi:hypothetical protein